MKKVLKTVLIVLIVLLIVLGIAAYLSRDIISAFLMAYTASEEELQNKVNSSGGIVDNNVLSEYTDIALRDLTEEEKAKLANNEISEEDAVALVMGMLDSSSADAVENADQQGGAETDAHDVQPPVSVNDPVTDEKAPENAENDVALQPEETQVPSAEPEKPAENVEEPVASETPKEDTTVSEETQQVNQKVAELVAKLYVVKARVTSNLDAYIEELRAEYLANKPTREERVATKPQFAAKAIKVVAKWEKECDTEINSLLSEIETLLKDSGQSLELVNTIRSAYEDEKAAKKAYCINRYLD